MASLTNRKKDSLNRTGISEQCKIKLYSFIDLLILHILYLVANDREIQAQSTCFKFQLNDIDNVLDRIKGTEKFRWLVALPVILGYSIGLAYLIPLFIKIPNLLWTGFNEEDGEFMYSCSASQMCSAKDYNYNTMRMLN